MKLAARYEYSDVSGDCGVAEERGDVLRGP